MEKVDMLSNIKTIKFKKLRALVYALALCLIMGSCLFASSNVSAEFQPNETQVTNAPIVDPEYDQATSQFAWVDNAGNLWIGKLNSEGMFEPASGKAIWVDPGAMSSADYELITNGPEWVQTNQGPQVVYTKFLTDAPHTADNARLGLAQLISPGQWEYKFLSPQLPRYAPYASTDSNDAAPRISYVDPAKNHYWCEINNPAVEHLITLKGNTMRSLRWVQGVRAIIFSAVSPIDNICQVFKYDIDTELSEQLTHDGGDKCSNPPWMWQAPEYNNEFVFFAVAKTSSNCELRIYKKDNNQAWTKIMTIAMPLNSHVDSLEPFTYKQHSYIFMSMTTIRAAYATSIWLANIDPLKPFFRKISDDTLLRNRFDPEVFVVSNQGPYIYYSVTDKNKQCNGQPVCYEGIFRVYTGIAP